MVFEFNIRDVADKTTNKNNKIPRSPKDAQHQLHKQYKFLCRSILETLKGDSDEIDRIALALRILFHTSGQSKSLLSQISPEIQLLETCSSIPLPPHKDETIDKDYKPFQGFMGGMVCMVIGSKNIWELTPSLCPSWVGIDEWWNRIFFTDWGIEFSRKKLVFCVANTDGGAHVDNELERCYFALTRLGSIGIQLFIDGTKHISNGPEKLVLPHIGLEVVSSLKRAFPDLCPDYGLPELI
ncbi:MAG: hypothetical protein Q8K60_04670 [Parachlamydiaceae bacterium]|nr:hypothetical protein [Parachlamydiaceae bacterium]